MADFILSCSSTADLSYEYFQKRNIPYVMMHYFIGDEERVDDCGMSLPLDEFYRRMSEGEMTRTSQLNSEDYIKFFTPFLEEGKDILHLDLSSGLSGTYQSSMIAIEELKEKYPERKILCVDTLGASSGFGLLVDTVADMRDAGTSMEEIYNFAQLNKLNVNHWFFCTDLTYFVRGGRVTKTAGFFGNMLNICPLLNVDGEGHLIPREKIRTKKKVKSVIVDRMAENAEGGLNYSGKCFISNSACVEDARDVAREVEKRFPNLNGPVQIYNIGTTIGSHTGPGTVALFFWGKERQ